MKYAALFVTLLLPSTLLAGTKTCNPPITTASAEPCGPFEKGMYEFDLTGGYMYSPVIATKNRPVLTYGQGDISLGWMLTSPFPGLGQNWLRGNWEALANVFGAGVVRGASGFMAGGRGLLRYNFVQPGARWVPFVQVGAGGNGDNIYEHCDQRLIGSGFEFSLVADIGVRYFLTPRFAAILMGDFEHVSNADTASRNLGVNAAGGMLGLGYFF